MIKRRTIYVDLCPFCGEHSRPGDDDECHYCGWPMGDDWGLAEYDVDSDVIVRVIVEPKPDKEASRE